MIQPDNFDLVNSPQGPRIPRGCGPPPAKNLAYASPQLCHVPISPSDWMQGPSRIQESLKRPILRVRVRKPRRLTAITVLRDLVPRSPSDRTLGRRSFRCF